MIGPALSPSVMEEAALGLAAGETMISLSDRLRVNQRTLERWKARDDFQERVRELRAEITRDVCGRLAHRMNDATAVLSELLKSDNLRVRLSAARQLLIFGTRLREAVEFEERLEALEQQVGVRDDDGDRRDDEERRKDEEFARDPWEVGTRDWDFRKNQ